MLRIAIPSAEFYDEIHNKFINTKGQVITIEHSLVSISKWESKYHKPFITMTKIPKTYGETIDYIRCMTLTQNVDPNVYYGIGAGILQQVNEYMDDSMTASWFSPDNTVRTSSEEITSELIYFWMIRYRIPFECQKWHINRLLTLIHMCHIKSTPPKKLSPTELARRNSIINEERKKRLNTTG